MTEEAKTPQSDALQPDNMDLIPKELEHYAPVLTGLTTLQCRILWVLVEEMTAEHKRTETEIAESIGISRSTIRRARKNPKFGQAMEVIVKDSLRGLHDKIIGRTIKAGENDWRANKWLTEYDGSYVQASKQLNINASLGPVDSPKSPQQAIEASCLRFISIGYDLQRYVEEITATWERLKEEGV
jgi:hypothetical protein